MKTLIVTKQLKKSLEKDLSKLTNELSKREINFTIVRFDEIDSFYEKIHEKNFKNTFDILISFGGDGTILKSARVARKLKIPILGINAGTIGFLTSVSGIKDIGIYIDKILKKDYQYEDRAMLIVSLHRDGQELFKSYAVNEATFTTKNLVKMGKYEVSISSGEKFFNEYRADGLIIASPTGSTGHSLSAGGPIVAPNVDCMIITAICPHAFNQRSIIISGKEKIVVKILNGDQLVDVDGRISMDLCINDEVEVSILKKPIKYITFEKDHFLNGIKNKIRNI